MATLVDPWGGYNQGMQNLGNTFTDMTNQKRQANIDAINLRRLAMDEKVKEAGLADAAAQQGALQQVYGVDNSQAAYAAKMKEEQAATRTKAFFDHLGVLDKAGASPEFISAVGKGELAKIPELAAVVPTIKFISKDKIVVVKDVGPNQVKDPSDPTQFLPPGKYELEGKATGNPQQPFAPISAKPYLSEEDKLRIQNENAKALKETWSEPYEATVGGKKAMVQKSSSGQIKPVIQDKSTTVVVKSDSGSNPVVQSQFVDPESGKPLVFDKKTGTYRISTVEGGITPKPAAFTPESAAKAQLIEQGLSYIPRIREGLIGADGKIDRMDVANIAARTPFTKGRELSTLILDAVEAKLRAESGAAVPDTEVKRIAKRYIPQISDSESTIKLKIDNMEKFLKGTSEKINKGRNKTPGKKPLSAY